MELDNEYDEDNDEVLLSKPQDSVDLTAWETTNTSFTVESTAVAAKLDGDFSAGPQRPVRYPQFSKMLSMEPGIFVGRERKRQRQHVSFEPAYEAMEGSEVQLFQARHASTHNRAQLFVTYNDAYNIAEETILRRQKLGDGVLDYGADEGEEGLADKGKGSLTMAVISHPSPAQTPDSLHLNGLHALDANAFMPLVSTSECSSDIRHVAGLSKDGSILPAAQPIVQDRWEDMIAWDSDGSQRQCLSDTKTEEFDSDEQDGTEVDDVCNSRKERRVCLDDGDAGVSVSTINEGCSVGGPGNATSTPIGTADGGEGSEGNVVGEHQFALVLGREPNLLAVEKHYLPQLNTGQHSSNTVAEHKGDSKGGQHGTIHRSDEREGMAGSPTLANEQQNSVHVRGAREVVNWAIKGSTCWLDAIVWDDEHPPCRASAWPWPRPIVDLNDERSLLERDLVPASDIVGSREGEVVRASFPKEKATKAQSESQCLLAAAEKSLAARIADGRLMNLSQQHNASAAFQEHKLANPQLAHRPIVRHLAMPPLQLGQQELLHRHRPHSLLSEEGTVRPLPLSGGKGVGIEADGQSHGATNSGQRYVHVQIGLTGDGKWRDDLSDVSLAADAPVDNLLLAEYIEEHPLMLNRPGMASKFVNYAKRATVCPLSRPLLGERRWIDDDSELPFVLGAEVAPDATITAMHTNLTCSPVAEHKPPDNTFILIVKRDADGKVTSVTLREAPTIVLVGQQQPVMLNSDVPAIPRPNSKEFKELLYRRVAHSIQRRIFAPSRRGPEGQWLGISLADIMAEWPRRMKPQVLEYLRSVATPPLSARQGEWKPHADARLEEQVWLLRSDILFSALAMHLQ